MERFYLEEANIDRKEAAIEYIEEHKKFNSKISGSGSLDKYADNYVEWLNYIELFKHQDTCPTDYCPGYTYFLIRENDDKIIGMINLRWNLNEWMINYGGNIGYGIRPTERKKGYNKINLYLCLLKAKEFGLNKVLLTVHDNNPGSYKTILSLGGVFENKVLKKGENVPLRRYWIDVNDSIEKHYEEYKEKIIIKEKKR